MKIPALLMASLLAVGVSAQTTKPEAKTKSLLKSKESDFYGYG